MKAVNITIISALVDNGLPKIVVWNIKLEISLKAVIHSIFMVI